MRSAHPRWNVLAVGIALLALAGCAADPEIGPTNAAPTPSPTASAPPPLADPAPRVGVDCAAVVDLAAVSTLLGGGATFRPTAMRFPADAAVLQAGVLQCSWSGPGSASLSIALSPLDLWASPPTSLAPACSTQPQLGQCGLWQVSGSFYVEAVATLFSDVNGSALQSAFDAVTAQLQAATAEDALPAWPSPERGPGGFPGCTGLDGSDLATALGATSGPVNYDSGDGLSGRYAAFAAAGYAACEWEVPGGNFGISYVPGSAWAFPTTGDPVTVDGADEARQTCDDFGCRIDARVGETWISAGYLDVSQVPAAGGRLATVIDALPVEPT
ncbi:MAG: hypothetical protein ABI566_12270 [Pseudolysinimonas sp.]